MISIHWKKSFWKYSLEILRECPHNVNYFYSKYLQIRVPSKSNHRSFDLFIFDYLIFIYNYQTTALFINNDWRYDNFQDNENDYQTRMHSSRMRTARSLPYRGGLCQGDLPWKEHGTRDRPPWKEHGTRQQERKWHHTDPSPPPKKTQNDTCK